MRAAPVRSGCRLASSWLMPSGKMPMVPRSASRSRQVRNVWSLPAVPPSDARWTGTTPARWRNGARGTILKSVDLPRNRGYRRRADISTRPSTSPLTWLATTITGRSGGSALAPTTSMRRKKMRIRSRARRDMMVSPARGSGRVVGTVGVGSAAVVEVVEVVEVITLSSPWVRPVDRTDTGDRLLVLVGPPEHEAQAGADRHQDQQLAEVDQDLHGTERSGGPGWER